MNQSIKTKLANLFLKQQQYNATLPYNPYSLKTAKTPAEVLSDPKYQTHLVNMLNGKEQDE